MPTSTRCVPDPRVATLRKHLLAGAAGLLLLSPIGAGHAADAHAADTHAEKPVSEKPARDKPAESAHAKADAAHDTKATPPATKTSPARAAAEAAAAKPVTEIQTLEQLRERLQERLATKKPASEVVHVAAKTEGVSHATAAGAQRSTHGSSAAINPAALAAAHRAGKTGHEAKGHDLKGAHHDVHWSYQGEGGPQAWGQLEPGFSTCAIGQRQSPIDIRGGIRVDLEPVQFDYRASRFGVVDNGHTVQVNVEDGNTIAVMGRRYTLVQFHFHRPSEERIDGRQFDMVAHLVHKDLEGRLAVVAVLLDRGSVHPLVQTVWNNLPLEKNEELRASGTIDLMQLLPQDRRYYTYMGSLTTPPCSEGVTWIVMAQPVGISPDQIAVFSHLYPMNARPVQAVSGRLIKASN